jgi:hypothetical protein
MHITFEKIKLYPIEISLNGDWLGYPIHKSAKEIKELLIKDNRLKVRKFLKK